MTSTDKFAGRPCAVISTNEREEPTATLNMILPILIVNRGIVSPTLDVNPALFVIPCIDLQCCNYCHLPGEFSSNFQSSMTIFHHKLLTKVDTILINGWTHPLSMTILARLFMRSVLNSYHHDIKDHMTRKIMFSVVTDKLVTLEKWLIELQEITYHFEGIYELFLTLIKRNKRCQHVNWLD